jgi:uncharacterized protein (TIGR03503 family)
MKNIFKQTPTLPNFFITAILLLSSITFGSLSFINNSFAVEKLNKVTPLGKTPATSQNPAIEPDNRDIRVLIDVSGSMKKNDPKNLRSPSLRLLVGLLPSNSTAGVWNFGTETKVLVKPSLVDDKWKQKAKKASKKIHSTDLFTNIGQALSIASQDWLKSSGQVTPGDRNIILLTDGMVDISKDDAKNKQERQRILTELLPKISAKQTQIHTIALSNKADFKFLKKLSASSDGSFEQAEDANALERLFLHLFEKAVKPDTIPLIENEFIIDDSVYEMTLLVFKDPTAKNQTTEIIEPSGDSYTQGTAPNYVKWQAEKNYDLLTIQKPNIGDWKINANIDPDNRVMVVTNLKIQTNYLPNNVFLGEEIDLKLFLMDQKEIITNDEFLHLTSIDITALPTSDDDDAMAKKWFLHDNGLRGDKKAHDGIFDVALGKSFKEGKNSFIIRASSGTFARELKQSFMVHDLPLLFAELEITEGQGNIIRRVRVSPNLEYLDPKNIKISAFLKTENSKAEKVTLKNDNNQQLEWYFEAKNLDQNEDYTITFYMQSHSRRGRSIKYTSKEIPLNINRLINENLYIESKEDQAIKVTVTKGQQLKPTSHQAKNTDEKIALQDNTEEQIPPELKDINSEKIDWTMGIIIAIVVNMIVAILAWFFYRRWKKNEDTDLIDLTGDMG